VFFVAERAGLVSVRKKQTKGKSIWRWPDRNSIEVKKWGTHDWLRAPENK
jgi:hypothetical protein